MKRLFLLITVLLITIGSFAQTSGIAGELNWRISNDTLFINGQGEMLDYSTAISDPNFSPWTGLWQPALTTVIVGEGITRIGNSAFYNMLSGLPMFSSLTTVRLPSTLRSIGSWAFYGCRGISSITIPDKVQSIGNGAFTETTWFKNQPDGLVYAGKVLYTYKGKMPDFTTITVKEGTLGIGDYAFSNVKGLVAVNLPEGLKHIGGHAFLHCSDIPQMNIPSSVGYIGEGAFYGCSGISVLSIPENVKHIYDDTFLACNGLRTINFPAGLESIGREAFRSCTSLTSIDIPDNVEILDRNVFYNCKALAEVSFPKKLITVGYRAFYNCSSLVSANLPDGVKTLESGCFSGCVKLTDVSLPDAIEVMADHAFSSCKALPSIRIPKKIDHIGEWTFHDCIQLTEIIWPENLESIADDAFYGCTKLTSLTLPSGLKTMGQSAFNNCNRLAVVEIPNSVTNIGSAAFMRCTALKTVRVNWEQPIAVIPGVFSLLTLADINLAVPESTMEVYRTAEVWKDFNIIYEYSVKIETDNVDYGIVEGNGDFPADSRVTVKARPNEGYLFVNWTNGTEVISTENPYTFTLNEDVELKANFVVARTLNLSMNGEEWGTFTGSGVYADNSEVTIAAFCSDGYVFLNWTGEDGEIISTENPYTFIITEDMELMGHFMPAIFNYSVEYYYDGFMDLEETEMGMLLLGEIFAYTPKEKGGYRLDYTTPETGQITISTDENSNIIRVHYVSVPYDYRIEYYYDNVLAPELTQIGKAFLGEFVFAEFHPRDGFKTEDPSPMLSIAPEEESNVLRVYWVKDSFDYMVEYYYDGVLDAEATETGNALFEETVGFIPKPKEGYEFENSVPESGEIIVGHIEIFNVIRVYYKKENITATDILTDGLILYPNPAKEKIYLSGIMAPTVLFVKDFNGRTVIASTVMPGEGLDVSYLVKGIYFVLIEGKTFKLIIE